MNFRKINVLKYQMIKIKKRKNDPQQNTYSLHVLMFIQIESLPPYLYQDKCISVPPFRPTFQSFIVAPPGGQSTNL